MSGNGNGVWKQATFLLSGVLTTAVISWFSFGGASRAEVKEIINDTIRVDQSRISHNEHQIDKVYRNIEDLRKAQEAIRKDISNINGNIGILLERTKKE